MNDILILHGWGSCTKNWQRVKGLLEEAGQKVYAPDLPGFGENQLPEKAFNIDDYVEWVKGFAEKNNLDRFFLMGHSFGGSVAIKFSLKYPEKISKLFLIDSAGIRKRKATKEIQKTIARILNKFSFLPFYSVIRKIAYRTIFRRSDYLLTEGIMKETYLNVLSEDISGILSQISVPTVLIWGKEDKITPLQQAYFMKEKITGAKLEIIPKIKHNPQSENPELLVETILKYL